MKRELIANIPPTTSATAAARRMRRFTTASLLLTPQGWHGRSGRLRSAWSRAVAPGRRRARTLAPAQGGQREVRQDTTLALRRFVDDNLVTVLEDLLHRFEVEPLQRYILCRFEGVVDRKETIGVALRLIDDLLAIAFRLLLDPHGIAPRPRDDVVAIGFRLVAQPLAIGECPLHVAKRVDDRGRGVDFLQLQLSDFDPGAVGIEDALQEMMRLGLDLAPPFGQCLSDRGLADHLAHRALGSGFDRRVRVSDVEEVSLSVLDYPEDREVDVDDVLIAGEHQRFFRQLTASDAAGGRALCGAVPDLGSVDAGHARREHLFDRGGKMVIESGLGGSVVGAEPQHDPHLVRQNAVEPACQPDDGDNDRGERNPATGAQAARQHAPETVLAPSQQLLEIGRPSARTGAAAAAAVAAPRAAAARTAAPRATALTLPEHRC